VSLVQAIQERTGDEFQGRVMGLLESATAGCYGLGFLLAGVLTALTSVRVTFAATAIGVLAATAWMSTLLLGRGQRAASAPALGKLPAQQLDQA
jgi:hypothetical protein